MTRYPRDMRGYGAHPPKVEWQGKAKIAVQFVLNYEEGGENCLLHGDAGSEAFLSEIVGAASWQGMRHWNMESIYEYGARAGFWRLHRLFTGAKIPLTIYGVATALARNPEQVSAMLEADWEIASHGYKWIDYKDFTPEDEAQHIADAIQLHTETTGTRPLGWYTGRCSLNTVDLVCKAGGLPISPTVTPMIFLIGIFVRINRISSFLIHWMRMICALRRHRVLMPATNFSITSKIVLMPSTAKAVKAHPKCCPSGYIAV